METRFYTINGINESGDPTSSLLKAVYDNGLKVYNVADSSDEGVLHVSQMTSPFHRDSADGPYNEELDLQPMTIVEYNRPWDSAGEAFNWFEGGII